MGNAWEGIPKLIPGGRGLVQTGVIFVETNDQSASEVESVDRMLGFLGGEDEEEEQIEQPETEEVAEEGDEEPEAEEVESEAEPEVEYLELVVNGEQVKKSKAETVELAQKGLDYTQKTQQLAEERRNAQAELNAKAQVLQLREHVFDKAAEAKSLEAQLAQYESIDWNALVDSDPVQAMKLDRQYRDLQTKHMRISNEINHAQQQVQANQQRLNGEFLEREKQSLIKSIPEWSDKAKSAAERDEIKDELRKAGYSDHEIDGLADHRHVVIARKAMLYDKLMSKKPEVQKRVAEAPKPIKPGAAQKRNPNAESYAKLRDSLKKTGRQDYATSAVEKLL